MKQVSTREVYRNDWMRVREDDVDLADGSRTVYGVVDKADFALIVPVGEQGFCLVEQYRYPIERRAWEFPQGSWAAGDSGTAEELARAELQEETGVDAGCIEHLGHLYPSYGFCSQGFDVFLATRLVTGEAHRELTEQDMQQRWVDADTFTRLIRSGDIVDAPTIAAWALLQLHDRRP